MRAISAVVGRPWSAAISRDTGQRSRDMQSPQGVAGLGKSTTWAKP
jgi:hypothetical protein